MKKLLFMLLCFMLCLSNLKADGVKNPVTFTLSENFYSDITKTYENGRTIFSYHNKILNMDLTDAQLDTILNQKSAGSRLVYYETLKIEIEPVEDTPYEVLEGETKYYRANDGGSWTSSVDLDKDMEEYAVLKSLTDYYWPWGFRVVYRTDLDDDFVARAPTGVDLTDKTLEEQIATILGYDLSANPDAVKDTYKTYWKFSLLNNYISLNRFDMFSKKDGVTPSLYEDNPDEYDVDFLNHLGTHYVAVKYTSEEDASASLTYEQENKKELFIPIAITIISILGISLFLLNKYKFKWF